MDHITQYTDALIAWIVTYGVKLLGAMLVFIVGLYLTNWLARVVTRNMSQRNFDVSLQSFLGSMISVGLKVLLLITVAGMLGIQTTSFVAVIGALGLAVDGDPKWRAFALDGYLFIALIYWVGCFAMSRYSRSLERAA